MSYADRVLDEFDTEMATTRRVLECVPDDQFDWKPTETTRTIGWNVNHLVELPGWVAGILNQDAWDVAPQDGPAYQPLALKTTREALGLFDQNVAAGRAAIQRAPDEAMPRMWSLLSGGETLFSMPREATLRTWVLSHTVHHRAILVTYLRLRGVEAPLVFGA